MADAFVKQAKITKRFLDANDLTEIDKNEHAFITINNLQEIITDILTPVYVA